MLIVEMDKPHRYNTWQWLLKRVYNLEANDRGRSIWSNAPDEVWSDIEHRDPIAWLCEQPLVRALRKGLPTGGPKLAALQERAKHWSTCPMRLRPEQRPAFAACTCVPRPAADGGAPTRAETT
jgi:hypothetical protein